MPLPKDDTTPPVTKMNFAILVPGNWGKRAPARGYGANHQKGECVIRLNGPYDIAVNRQQDGTYGLTTDWWGGHVETEVGPSFGKLLQLYGVNKTALEASKKGYLVTRQTLKNGSIKVILQGV